MNDGRVSAKVVSFLQLPLKYHDGCHRVFILTQHHDHDIVRITSLVTPAISHLFAVMGMMMMMMMMVLPTLMQIQLGDRAKSYPKPLAPNP